MALTKEILNDKIEVINTGDFVTLQVRIATVVKEDGAIISKKFSRKVIYPDADISQEDLDVYAVANAVFTDEVKAAYAAYIASQEV